MANETIINFSDVTFEHGYNKEILDEVNFSVRSGMKVAKQELLQLKKNLLLLQLIKLLHLKRDN